MELGNVHDEASAAPPAASNAARAGVVPPPAVFDLAHLRRYTAGSAELEREIIELYCKQIPVYLRNLAEAATSKDWHFAAHTIKGSALAIGAQRLAALAARAEQASATAYRAHVEELVRANGELLSELARLRLA